MGAMDVVLASQSPRRREILGRIFREFRVVPSGLDETVLDRSDPVVFVREAAELKARDIGARFPEALIIAADTIVCLEREIFGKPKDREEAAAMLARLSGRRHRVLTGVALFRASDDRVIVSYETTYVTFKPFGREEIEAYLDRNAYADKAGSYAIQDVGETFVEQLEGDYDNVVGFPLKRFKKMLREFKAPETDLEITGIAFPKSWPVGKAKDKDRLGSGSGGRGQGPGPDPPPQTRRGENHQDVGTLALANAGCLSPFRACAAGAPSRIWSTGSRSS